MQDFMLSEIVWNLKLNWFSVIVRFRIVRTTVMILLTNKAWVKSIVPFFSS